MRTLTPNEVDQLVGNGYCFMHVHPKVPLDFSDITQLESVQPSNPITGDYELTRADSLVLVDTSAGSITVTMPLAAKGREFQITKMTPQNALWIVPTPPDRILGSAVGVVLYNQYSSLHFKAVEGNADTNWIAI